MSDEGKQEAGISPGLVRVSIGYTGTLEQRWTQLVTALEETGIIDARSTQANVQSL